VRGFSVFFDDQPPECLQGIPATTHVLLMRNGGNFDFAAEVGIVEQNRAVVAGQRAAGGLRPTITPPDDSRWHTNQGDGVESGLKCRRESELVHTVAGESSGTAR
jgi:hypothetical protein